MGKKTYGQSCALAHAADVIGERWSVLIIRDLLIRPRRYGELARSLKGMGTNLLADRLKQLEKDGVLHKKSGEQEYRLTEAGWALEPALLSLIRWGFTLKPKFRGQGHHQDDWDLLALKAAYEPSGAPKSALLVQFQPESEPFWVKVSKRTFEFGFGHRDHADLTIFANLSLLAQQGGKVQYHGTAGNLKSFLGAFKRP